MCHTELAVSVEREQLVETNHGDWMDGFVCFVCLSRTRHSWMAEEPRMWYMDICAVMLHASGGSGGRILVPGIPRSPLGAVLQRTQRRGLQLCGTPL